jgi:hypothetical protein
MISYRANLFESINKQITIQRGAVYECTVSFWAKAVNELITGNANRSINTKVSEKYLCIGGKDGKSFLREKMNYGLVLSVDSVQLKNNFKKIGQFNLDKFKKGDEVIWSSEKFIFLDYGLNPDGELKSYLIYKKDYRDNSDLLFLSPSANPDVKYIKKEGDSNDLL